MMERLALFCTIFFYLGFFRLFFVIFCSKQGVSEGQLQSICIGPITPPRIKAYLSTAEVKPLGWDTTLPWMDPGKLSILMAYILQYGWMKSHMKPWEYSPYHLVRRISEPSTVWNDRSWAVAFFSPQNLPVFFVLWKFSTWAHREPKTHDLGISWSFLVRFRFRDPEKTA